ncbi:MAG: CsbD family protein [Planctomycetota bacterium]
MNNDIIKGKWQQLKGKVKQQWGKLTDDDMQQIEGNLDIAAGRLQERYGYTREHAEKAWKEFCQANSAADKRAEEV